MMSCKEVTERASALIDGELGAWETIQMRVHLMMCKGCDRFIKQMRITQDLIQSAGMQKTADATDEDRITAILSRRHTETGQGE